MFQLLVLLLLLLHTTDAADYVVISSDIIDPSQPAKIITSILPGAGNATTGKPSPPNVNGYLGIVSNGAPHFRSFPPLDGEPCGTRVRTSVTALAHNCRLATNAAPFDMDSGACNCGYFIHTNKTYGTGGWKVSFSSTQDGKWVIGTLNASIAAQLGVVESVNGFSWLVRDGVNVHTKDTYIAPRTTIGVTRDGKLIMLEVDGCEAGKDCAWTIGRTEYEMAELLLQHDAYHAINLDGGGSSSFVANGIVMNHPTDTDVWRVRKVRAVTVIGCIV